MNCNNSSNRPRIRRGNNQFLERGGQVASPPRLKTTYSEYLKIKDQLAKKEHPLISASYDYYNGVICFNCDGDPDLNGWFTKSKPVEKFDYHELKIHPFTKKHYNRCSKEEKKIIDELRPGGNSMDKLTTEFDAVCNTFDSLARYCANGYAFMGFDKIADFIKRTGGNI